MDKSDIMEEVELKTVHSVQCNHCGNKVNFAHEQPEVAPEPWHEISEDSLGRLYVGMATEGDQLLAYNAICEAQIFADMYVEFSEKIEPFVLREGSNPYGPLPGSVIDSFGIVFDHWLLTTQSPAPKAQSKWQPIETAPKDGELIITLTKNGDVCTAHFKDTLVGWLNAQDFCFQPTHWMPLPKAIAEGVEG